MIPAIPLLLALQASPHIAAGGAAAELLRQDKVHFCHDPEYPLTTWEHQWCPVVGEDKDCPAFAVACKGPPIEGPMSAETAPGARTSGKRKRLRATVDPNKGRRNKDTPGEGGPGAKGGSSGSGGASKGDPADRERQSVSAPSGAMSGLARMIFFALLAIGVIAVARAIFANLLRDGDDKEPAEDESRPEAKPAAEPMRQGPVETDVARLLARAKAAAARGQYEQALQDAYAALVRRLEGSGLIDIHPSRTNGDYVRDLRDRPELKASVREIFRDVERVQFGSEAASAGIFQSVFDRVVVLAGQALGILLLCLGLGAAISCTHDKTSSGLEWSVDEDSSPSGMALFMELLRQNGINVRHRQRSLRNLGDENRTLVLMSDVELDESTWKHLFEWFDRTSSTLIIAGSGPLPDRIHARREVVDETSSSVVTADSDYYASDMQGLAVPSRHGLALRGDAAALLIRGKDTPYAAYQRSQQGRIFVFADDNLFSNIALVPANNAGFIVDLFKYFEKDVEFCDGRTGAGATTPLDSVESAKLTPVILQLMALLALFLLYKGVPFGKLRDPKVVSRRAFSDHARALGVHYERARASKHVLGHYSSWAIERLRERTQRGARRGLTALAEAIAARVHMPESEVMRVLVEAQSAHDESAPPSFRPSTRGALLQKPDADEPARSRDLALMRELDRFLTLTGGGEHSPKQKPIGPT